MENVKLRVGIIVAWGNATLFSFCTFKGEQFTLFGIFSFGLKKIKAAMSTEDVLEMCGHLSIV